MAIFKSIRTSKMKTHGQTRAIRRAGTKTKVLEPRKGTSGPYQKSRFARTWKRDGVRQRTATNPRFGG